MDLAELFFQLYVLEVVLFFLPNSSLCFFLMTLTCHYSYFTIVEVTCRYPVSQYSSHMDLLSLYLTIQAGTAIVPSSGLSLQGVFFVHSCLRTYSWTAIEVRGNCKQLQM